jgi:hypothetical protein
MSVPTKAPRTFIYVKPGTEERLTYTSMAAAARACTLIGGQIEEWHATGDKMQLRCVWTRKLKGSSVSGLEARWIQHGG